MSRGISTSLEHLIALNDEIAALVRAGVPLDQGLREIGQEAPGRIGELAHRIGIRMSAGETLPQILASDERAFPPLWRAVVEAGMKSGRLAAALEAMSTTARQLAEMRRTIRLSLVYPLVIVAMAFGLFVLLVTFLAPVILNFYEDTTYSQDRFLSVLVWLGESVRWWGVLIPIVACVVLLYWRYRSTRAAFQDDSFFTRVGAFVWPPIGEAARESRAATFTELLALLLEQQVPLPYALVLAGNASGDRRWASAAGNAAQRLKSGVTVLGDVEGKGEHDALRLPPLLDWMIGTGGRDAQMSAALARAGTRYRQRATRAAESTFEYLPVALTAVLGGVTTLLLGVAVFDSFLRLLHALAIPA